MHKRFSTVKGFAIAAVFGLATLPAQPLELDPAESRGPDAAASGDDRTELCHGAGARRQSGHQNGKTQNGKTQNGKTQDGGEQGTLGEIDKYSAMLHRVGPEARAGREQAIEALFSIPDLRAHQVLHEFVVPGADRDGTRESVLTRLPVRLLNTRDPVFHQGPNAGMFRRSYVSKLVEHFGQDRKSAEGETEESRLRLRKLARAALLALGTGERRDTFEELMKSKLAAVRRATLRAAGECQDFGHAELIASHLESAELGAAAREALFNLTFKDFADRKEFDGWFAANSERTYLELAEDAIRQMKQEYESRTRSLDERLLATIVKHMGVLAVSNLEDKWKLIHTEVFPKVASEQSLTIRRACLEKLRDVLAEAPPVVAGKDANDRLQFFDALTANLTSTAMATDRALLLEVASYVCAVTETRQRTLQRTHLVAGLDHGSPVVQLAALRGVRRFFSPEIRAKVLHIAEQARVSQRMDTLAAAVDTLKSQGWVAPDPGPERIAWAVGLHSILADDDLPEPIRVGVIDVLCLSDAKGNKVDEAFTRMLQEIARPAAPVKLRQRMILMVQGLLPNPSQQAERDKAAKALLENLVALQKDQVDPMIRRAAASMLVVPDKVSREQQPSLGKRLAEDVGARLLAETDELVFKELVGVLTKQHEIEDLASVVTSRLRRALEELSPKEENKLLVNEVVLGLRQIAMKKGQPIVEWARTCECLLVLRDRQAVRTILAYHMPRNDQIDSAEKELQARVWKLVIHTAALAPQDLPWGDPGNRREAELVNKAVEELLEDGSFAKDPKDLDTPANRLTYLRCLRAVGRHGDLTTRAELWLQPNDKILTGTAREEARLLLAQAYLDQSKATEAWARSGMQSIGGALLERRLELQQQIAAVLKRTDAKQAAKLLEDVLEKTAKDAPTYWPRLREFVETSFEADQSQGAVLLNRIESWRSTEPKLTQAQSLEVLQVKTRLKGEAKPPKVPEPQKPPR